MELRAQVIQKYQPDSKREYEFIIVGWYIYSKVEYYDNWK